MDYDHSDDTHEGRRWCKGHLDAHRALAVGDSSTLAFEECANYLARRTGASLGFSVRETASGSQDVDRSTQVSFKNFELLR